MMYVEIETVINVRIQLTRNVLIDTGSNITDCVQHARAGARTHTQTVKNLFFTSSTKTVISW